jgi:hypothetical protein
MDSFFRHAYYNTLQTVTNRYKLFAKTLRNALNVEKRLRTLVTLKEALSHHAKNFNAKNPSRLPPPYQLSSKSNKR